MHEKVERDETYIAAVGLINGMCMQNLIAKTNFDSYLGSYGNYYNNQSAFGNKSTKHRIVGEGGGNGS